MAAKDFFHNDVKNALINDGWTVTHDPFKLNVLGIKQSIDFGAEKIIAAEKGSVKIAVEVKSFLEDSFVYAFYNALGQFTSYRINLRKVEEDRIVFLAVPQKVFETYFQIEAIRETVQECQVKIIVFEPETKQITQWIH